MDKEMKHFWNKGQLRWCARPWLGRRVDPLRGRGAEELRVSV